MQLQCDSPFVDERSIATSVPLCLSLGGQINAPPPAPKFYEPQGERTEDVLNVTLYRENDRCAEIINQTLHSVGAGQFPWHAASREYEAPRRHGFSSGFVLPGASG